MKNRFISHFKIALWTCLICFFSSGPAYSGKSHTLLKKYSEIPVQISSKVKQSVLNSAVKVEHVEGGSYGSGSYIVIDNHFLVLTAAHVVDTSDVFHVKNRYETVVGTVIYRDNKNDIAFLLVPQMRSRIPLAYKKDLGTNLAGEPVVYAGYPNSHDLLLFFGRVAGTAGESLIMHSYAWMGSSGSVVVNMKGKIVGVLTAVDVGMFANSPHLIEDAVWVSSIGKVNEEKLRATLDEI